MTATYEVTALKYGRQRYPGPAVFYFSRWFEWVDLDFYFWLIRGNGLTILIDVGMSQEHADAANPHLKQLVGDEALISIFEDPIAILARQGIAPSDVDLVVLTHMHLDHACNVSKFPNATFVTSRRGFEWIRNPKYPSLISDVAIPPHIIRFLVDEAQAQGRLRLTDDREEIVPGIQTLRTGGHTFDHQIVLINTSRGYVGLAVDNFPLFENLDSGTPIGSPFDVLSALESLDILRKEADIIVPGHDPEVTARFPGGSIA